MPTITEQSTLTKKQVKHFGPKPISGYGKSALIKAEVRYDDECGNGHNTFAITADVYIPGRRDIEAGGCMHDEIAQHFPELAPLIKWHLCSSDGPMHYPGNVLYHAGGEGKARELDSARHCAIWPEATDEELTAPDLKERLDARLPKLLEEFRAAVESLGFVW